MTPLRRCRVAGCGCTLEVGQSSKLCAPCQGTGDVQGGVCGACHGIGYARLVPADFFGLAPRQQLLGEAIVRRAEELWAVPRGVLSSGSRHHPLPDIRACVAVVLDDQGWTSSQIGHLLGITGDGVRATLARSASRVATDPELRTTVDELLDVVVRSRSPIRRVS